MLRIILFLFVLLIISVRIGPAQIIFEPNSSFIYPFLERQASKGLIELHDIYNPMPRKFIALKLKELLKQDDKLSPLDKEDLKFYLKEYTEYQNIKKAVSFIQKNEFNKYQFFEYRDSSFYLNVIPLEGRFIGQLNQKIYQQIWDGISLYGYYTNYFGFQFKFKNIAEKGENIDIYKSFTPQAGNVVLKNKIQENHISYDDVKIRMTFSWDIGFVSIGKDDWKFGYGKSGNVIKSIKAPSFPFFEIYFKPCTWLTFRYSHNWLNSQIIDSLESYNTYIPQKLRKIYRSKYMAFHSVTIHPSRYWDISLGESIVYSDNLKFVYLQPLMFFRAADHYLSNVEGNDAGDNAQIFFSGNIWNWLFKNHLYFSLFIDEFSLKRLFSKGNRNQIGIQLGLQIEDIFLDNLSFSAEYVRINPFVYQHYIPTITYASDNYTLGHWMGGNAESYYLAFDYRLFRGLQTSLWWEFIRKGDTGSVQAQYSAITPSFLFGELKKIKIMGLNIKYEIIHRINLMLSYEKYSSNIIWSDWPFESKQYDILKTGFTIGLP